MKNQGACGSPWAFAPVAVVESKLLILQNVTMILSEQELVSCAAQKLGSTLGDSCNGGFATDALNYIQSYGIASSASFPYQGTNLACPANLPPSVAQISGYYTVAVDPNSTANTIQNIKQAIYNDGPVAAYVFVDNLFMSYTGGVFTDNNPNPPNHMIALVGYDDTGAYWIGKNSWGTSWGESGYIQISYNANIGMYLYGALAVQKAFALTVLPPISSNPNPVSFGNVNVGSSSTQSVILTINNGMTISNVQASGDYSVTGNSCIPLPYTVPASSTCTLQVQFAPTMPGQRWAALMVTDNTSNNYTFGLEGTGVGSALAFTPGIMNTVAGNGTAGFVNGTAASAEFNRPVGVVVDSAGNLYIADTLNNCIRKVDVNGNISTVAGNGTAGTIDGAAASAEFNQPTGVAVDSAGNLYVADQNNQRIRKLDANGNISTVAGSGTAGFAGDGAAAVVAELNQPAGVAVDSAGNLYIADQNNQRIRKVDTSGNISTVVGNGTAGFAGDGAAAALAELNQPAGVAVDSAGNLFIVDQNNQRIRKVDTSGNISTVVGNGNAGFIDGAGASVELNQPTGVAVDSAGNLYIADQNNQRIRKVDTSGNISTVAGNGTAGFGGDGVAAAYAELSQPAGVAVDDSGSLYIADEYNQRIRKVDVSKSMLSFGLTSVGVASSPQTVQISDVGTAPLNFIAPSSSTTAFTFPSNFQPQKVGNDCATGTPLAVGATCSLGVAFAPTVPGNSLTGKLTVNDDAFNSQQAVTVTGSTTQEPPTITSASSAIFTVGTFGNSTVTTTGFPTPSITENGVLPSGVNFVDNGDGTGALSGTPVSGTAGAYAITIAASNGVSPNATQNFTVNVLNNLPTGALPAHWDWREQGAVTPVKNQGACGADWAFAPVAVVESKLLIQQNLTMILSEQELVSCTAQTLGKTGVDSCSAGGAPSDALDYIQSYGIASTASFPYQGTNLACPANLPPSVAQIDGYYTVAVDPNSTANTIQNIKQAIYNDGPVAAYVFVDNLFMSYTGGVFTDNNPNPPNHMIALVGFDDAGQYWIAKNSWGTTWGESGYVQISYNANIGMYQFGALAVQRAFALGLPSQTITFGSLSTKTYGDAPFNISASASSGLQVGFNVSGSCSVSANTVTITGAGSCNITASQPGGGTYSPAPPVTQSFTVNQVALTVTATDQSKTYDGMQFSPFTVSYIGFVNNESASVLTGTVSFSGSAAGAIDAGTYTIIPGGLSSNNYSITYVNGSLTINQANANITVNGYSGVYDGNPHSATGTASGVQGEDLSTLLNLGSSFSIVPGGTANWSFAGNTDYKPASGSVSINITKATPAITWPTPASITYGTALSGTQLDATASALGAFTYSPTTGTVLTAGSQTLSVAFTPTDATDYTTATATVTLTVNKATPTITWVPAAIAYGTLLGANQLDATANVPGTFVYAPAAGTPMTTVGSQPLSVSFTPTDTTDYTTASATATLTVTQAASTISLATSPSGTAYGSLVTFTATVTDASAGSTGTPSGTVNFYVGGARGVLIGTGTLNAAGVTTLITSTLPPGTYSVTGVYSGNTNFTGSTNVLQEIVSAVPVVSISPDAITFAPQNVNTTSAPMPVVLTNIGTLPLSLSSIQVNGNDSSSFAILSTTCSTGVNSLAAGASCTVNVAFSPTDTGDRMSSLVFTDNDGGALTPVTQVIGLLGSSVSTSKANFTNQSIAAGNTIWFSSVLSLKAPCDDNGHELDMSQNKVQIFVTGGKISFTAGGQSYNLNVPDGLVILDPTVTTATTTFDGAQWITTVPAVAPPNHMQQFDVGGEIFATGLPWQVPTGGLPGGIQNVSWSASYSTDTPGIGITWKWGAAVYTSFVTGPGLYNGVGVKPIDDLRGPCNFQNSTNNPAGTPENFKSFWVLGATGDDMGDYVGDWTRDTGVIPSANPVTVDPYPLVFTPIPAGSSSNSALVTVTNINASLSAYVASVTVTDSAEFTVTPTSGPCTIGSFVLPPSSSCTYSVTFAPGGIGTSTGTIAFTFTPPPGMGKHDMPAPITVDMVGTGMGGTNPYAALSAVSLKFPRQMINTSSASQNVMLVNAGGAPLTGISVASTNSGEFVITSNSCSTTLAPAASCIVGVTFTPTAVGSQTGALTFTYGNNSGGATQTVSMTGSGSAW